MNPGRAAGLALSLAIVTYPRTPAAQPPPAPVGSVVPATYDEWNAWVFTAGAIVFLGSYGGSAAVAATSDRSGAQWLYVPVVGPWLAYGAFDQCPSNSPVCMRNTTDNALLVLDSLCQTAGILTMGAGLLLREPHHGKPITADRGLHVTPTHNGFAVFGRF